MQTIIVGGGNDPIATVQRQLTVLRFWSWAHLMGVLEDPHTETLFSTRPPTRDLLTGFGTPAAGMRFVRETGFIWRHDEQEFAG